VKDLYRENYNTMKKGITRKWKHLLYSWISRTSVMKMPVSLKAIRIVNANSTTVPLDLSSQRERNQS
jgi:hypothetical protein